ncbi:MAG: DUF983 domain-containing protein [Thermonemataceae bacterium]|nr:DUF983 domain-containing protein [Thermonemataceae bacterium]
MKRRTKLQAIVACKCPRCRQGDLFEKKGIYPKPLKNCPVCGVKYEKEPNFFEGAMYVGYAFSVALFVVAGFSTYFIFNDPEPWVYMAVILPLVLVLSPFNLRYSKSLFIHVFGDYEYEPESIKK